VDASPNATLYQPDGRLRLEPLRTLKALLTDADAEGSVEECRYYLILAEDLGYARTAEIMSSLEEASRLLCSYTKAILDSHSES